MCRQAQAVFGASKLIPSISAAAPGALCTGHPDGVQGKGSSQPCPPQAPRLQGEALLLERVPLLNVQVQSTGDCPPPGFCDAQGWWCQGRLRDTPTRCVCTAGGNHMLSHSRPPVGARPVLTCVRTWGWGGLG